MEQGSGSVPEAGCPLWAVFYVPFPIPSAVEEAVLRALHRVPVFNANSASANYTNC